MEKVSCEDTCVSNTAKRMTMREALLHDKRSRIAAAVDALDELHDDNDIDDVLYGLSLMGLRGCVSLLDTLIEAEQRLMELKWPEPNVDPNTLLIPGKDSGCFEITRLRIMP